jgi:hypothetical protein
MAITPAMIISIGPLKFFAEANVEPAHDEEHDDDSDKKQIHHWISFKFSLVASGATPHSAAPIHAILSAGLDGSANQDAEGGR